MSQVDNIVEQYATALQSGADFDYGHLTAGLDDFERRELQARIGMLDRQLSVNADGVDRNDPRVERLRRSASGLSGVWPSMLPRLRERKDLDRADLAKQLAERLGQPDSADKVEEYYHQLEWGNLPANKVDRSVVKALSEILEEDEQELWEAGTGGVDQWSKKVRRSQSGGLPKRAFARLVGENKPLTVDDSQFDPPAKSDWDDTDRLFLGG